MSIMIVVQVLSILLSLGVLVTVLFRLLIQYKIKQVKDLSSYPKEFRKKFQLFIRRENEKHINYLLILSAVLGSSLIITTGTSFYLQGQVNHLSEQSKEISNRLDRVKAQQDELIVKVPVRNYPKDGVGLKKYDWNKVFGEDNGSSSRAKLEEELAHNLSPYFGLAQAIISIDVPSQTLTISLTGNTENVASKDTIVENIKSFVNEANDVAKLTQIHIQMTSTVDKKNETFYKESYLRENDSKKFILQDKEEADNSKGKG